MATSLPPKKIRLLATAFLMPLTILQIFPVVYAALLSFKNRTEIFHYPPQLWPEHFDLSNYQSAFEIAPLGRFLLNSALISISVTILQVLTSVLAAYALARLEFPGRKWLLIAIAATMLVPGEITVLPNFLTIARLDMIDHYSGLILPFAATGFGVFFLYQFMSAIPKELEEAALLDGASRFRFLWQFAIPFCSHGITAFAIYAFVNSWNQYFWPLIVTQSTSMQTAQIGLGVFRAQNESMSWGVVMAATLVLAGPTLILFWLTQRQFTRALTASGIKG